MWRRCLSSLQHSSSTCSCSTLSPKFSPNIITDVEAIAMLKPCTAEYQHLHSLVHNFMAPAPTPWIPHLLSLWKGAWIPPAAPKLRLVQSKDSKINFPSTEPIPPDQDVLKNKWYLIAAPSQLAHWMFPETQKQKQPGRHGHFYY